MTGDTADPGQDPRGAPDPAPLWNVLDTDARKAAARTGIRAWTTNRSAQRAPLPLAGRGWGRGCSPRRMKGAKP